MTLLLIFLHLFAMSVSVCLFNLGLFFLLLRSDRKTTGMIQLKHHSYWILLPSLNALKCVIREYWMFFDTVKFMAHLYSQKLSVLRGRCRKWSHPHLFRQENETCRVWPAPFPPALLLFICLPWGHEKKGKQEAHSLFWVIFGALASYSQALPFI